MIFNLCFSFFFFFLITLSAVNRASCRWQPASPCHAIRVPLWYLAPGCFGEVQMLVVLLPMAETSDNFHKTCVLELYLCNGANIHLSSGSRTDWRTNVQSISKNIWHTLRTKSLIFIEMNKNTLSVCQLKCSLPIYEFSFLLYTELFFTIMWMKTKLGVGDNQLLCISSDGENLLSYSKSKMFNKLHQKLAIM